METALVQENLFDYDALEEIHREPIKRATEEIRHFQKQATTAVLKIGQRLIDVRRRIPSVEQFEAYLDAELGWKLRSAYNFMNVFKQFGEEKSIEKIAPSALYLLSAPGTPQEARAAALQLAEDGHEVTNQVAKTIVEETKTAEKSRLTTFLNDPPADDEAEEEAEIEISGFSPTCLCTHAQSWHENEVSNCKLCKCECFEAEKVTRENTETLVEMTETETVTETKTDPAPKAKPVIAPVTGLPKAGEADIAFEKANIQIVITLYPKKGEDRDGVISLRANDGTPTFEMVKYSQIADLFTNFTLNKQVIALKDELAKTSVPTKKVEPSKPAPTKKPAAKLSSKTTTKTTKVTATKGRKK